MRGRDFLWGAWLVLATAACAHVPAPPPRPAPVPAAPASGPSAVVGAPVWTKTVAEATSQARLVRRGLLMVFCADWAIPCKQMAKAAFAHPAVTTEMSTRFILLPVDLTHEEDEAAAAVARQYGVSGVPTLVALDADGRERGRATQAVTAAELLVMLQQAAADLPRGPALAAMSGGGCDLAVEELLSAEVLRGRPPGRRNGGGEASPEDVDQAPYLACSYRVRMGARRYRYHRTSHVGETRRGPPLTPMMCVELGEMGAALAEIRGATAGCREPEQGRQSGVEAI